MSYQFARCQWTPLPDSQASAAIDGVERLRWHFAAHYPRPFFYPLVGASGHPLTRMGHPGAPNHDHHRSIWFAHQKVLGIDFWSDNTPARIRQKQWLQYQDGDEEAVMAVLLGWYDGHDPAELLEQELIVAVRPDDGDQTVVEIQSSFRPRAETLEFGQTNFGFLAVRVAKHISAHFGAGELTDSEGRSGEPAIFGQRAAWMDYTGPARGQSFEPSGAEGITYFDHPSNPGFPSHWHVRADGWMGASVCREAPRQTSRQRPLMLRYLLHAHRGAPDRGRARDLAAAFAEQLPFEVVASPDPHQHRVVRRK